MTTAALSLPLVGAWPRVCSRETMRLLLTGDDAISPRWALFVARLFCPVVCPMASVPVAFPDDVARAQAAVSSRGTAGHLMVELLPRVRNLVRYLVRGDAMVDDLAQEAIVAILRGYQAIAETRRSSRGSIAWSYEARLSVVVASVNAQPARVPSSRPTTTLSYVSRRPS